MFDPVKIAWGEYMARFHAQIVPTNRQIEGFLKLPLGEAKAGVSSGNVL